MTETTTETNYELPDDALRHLPLLIEAAKGIVNVYTWRGSKGYTAALQQGVAELQAALKPFVLPVDRYEARLNEMREHREMMEAAVHAGVFEVGVEAADGEQESK